MRETYYIEIKKDIYPCIAQFKDSYGYKREMDSFKINYTSGKRVYITPIKDNVKITEVAKNMIFDNGLINLKQGNQIINIGTYQVQ